MGIRGLTTFINNRAHLYLEDYQLHNSNVVIDGNSLASNLYKWHCKSNDCFGGDYDKFAQVIETFFDILHQCNITPYVVLDGGYENRKLTTVISRMKNKIHAAASLNAVTEGSESVFPLFLREVFVDVVIGLGVKVARCQFEGDMQTAAIAQALRCPVISYDSDYYILGCLYIPFSTVDIVAKKAKGKSPTKSYTYLPCKIYHIENFLQAYGGLDKENLPLLSVLLGNDYIKGTLFAPFFRNLKMQKCSSCQSDQQKRIKSVIVWLQNENIESALRKILVRFKGEKRHLVLKKIESALKGFNVVDPDLLTHFEIKPVLMQVVPQINFDQLIYCKEEWVDRDYKTEEKNHNEECTLSDLEETSENTISEISDDDATDSETIKKSDSIMTSHSFFQDKYRKCQYPACFMDLVTLKKYYCIPQVEDSSSDHSHTISLEILKIIYEILVPTSVDNKGLTVVFRSGRGRIQYEILPRLNAGMIVFKDIEHIGASKKNLLQQLLQIDDNFKKVLTSVSVEWHLFLIGLKYAINKGSFDEAIICSSIICFVILNYVDPKIGFCRVSKTYNKKFAQVLITLKSKNVCSEFKDFSELDKDNCLIFMDKMVSYFQMDSKLKSNHRLYDRGLVHSFSQIQSVFLHIKYLNSLLDNPFPILKIHKIFDGTFLYNLTSNFRKRTNIVEYLEGFLKDCPSILAGIKQVFDLVMCHFNPTLQRASMKSRRKKKKVSSHNQNLENDRLHLSEDESTDCILDPNNPYSVLAVI